MDSLRSEIRASPAPTPSNDDIEAIIQLATSSRSSDGRPPRDTRTQLFVGNLPYRVRWQDLKDLFRKAGTVLRADVSLGSDNRSRGHGTVLLATAEDAGRAVDMFNGYSWQTRVLEVRPDRLPPDFDQAGGTGSAASYSNAGPSGSDPNLGEFDYASSMVYGHERAESIAGGSRNLFVGNLPFHCQWQDLKDLFRQAGTILRADVALGPDGRSRGFGTVVFATEYDAERAVKIFNGYEYNGRQLKVHYDKFSGSTAPMTAPTSPTLVPAFSRHAHSFSNSFSPSPNPPNHIQMIVGTAFDFTHSPGPSSPYDTHPPPMPQPQPIHPPQSNKSNSAPTVPNVLSTSTKATSPTQGRKTSSQPHPHGNHPGPISLPPPPTVSGFPIPPPHTLSPHAMSPLHHHIMGSPLHHPGHHPHPIMTPHGLPPITPSMPPFTFLPQPSPHHTAQNMTPTAMSAAPMHVLTPFSPGTAMSPGAFWGRPGGGANPFINPAVGAPVHNPQGGFFGMPSPPVAQPPEESQGYFPPVVADSGYFPPMASLRSSGLVNELRRGDDSSPSEATDVGGSGGRERRPSTSTGTPWTTPEEPVGEFENLELEGKESAGSQASTGSNGRAPVRTSSMNASPKNPVHPGLGHRSGSDPVQAHSRTVPETTAEDRYPPADGPASAYILQAGLA